MSVRTSRFSPAPATLLTFSLTDDALKHPWLATTSTDGVSAPALPLLVSSLPFNSGAAPPPHNLAIDSPAITSPTFSGSFGDSMLYSQQLGAFFFSFFRDVADEQKQTTSVSAEPPHDP